MATLPLAAETAEPIYDRASDYRVIGSALAVSAVYATLRYNVCKGVAWAEWPHYIGNKIIAVTALILFTVAVWRLVSRTRRPIRRLMAVGSALALTHTLVSLGLFRPVYYEKYFAGDGISLTGGLSILLGGAAMALLHWGKGRKGSSAPATATFPLALIAFVTGLHAAAPSLPGWLDPASWPGHLPPITLISFLIGAVALALALPATVRTHR